MMLVYGTHHSCIERQELQVLVRGLARRKKVHSGICNHRPVAVLSGPVHPVERLLVEKYFQMVLFRHFLHDDHQHHVLVDRLGGAAEDRSTLELVRSDLVVSGLEQDTEFVCLCLEILHESAHPRRDGSEIVVFKLLVLGRSMPDDSAVAEDKVRPCIVKGLVYKEIFLFKTEVDTYAPDRLVEKIRD